ncbi:hypothetical protein [Chelativorans sp. YIM 93263]|uniref:hypothetical protein n=1 Tax=Chelativorans sp. YIM 93263 TaxID=2906648 RepID=UPI0023784BA6|nr:hypothetical protein [Chelativorans sp. YIM 93263]
MHDVWRHLVKRWCLVGFLALAVTSCQTNSGSEAELELASASSAAPASESSATPSSEATEAQYFIEFRSRYALSYGHSFVIFGRTDSAGNMIDPEVAGLHPASDSSVPYILGHLVPVPAETGWSDGDLDDRYMSANWRIPLDKDEYQKVVADIRELQNSSRTWHAALYNCNAFVAEIARSMGYKTPFIWLKPRVFITKLREMNGGPDAIGVTRPAA